MRLNNMLDDLLDLAKQENEPNRYAHSEEYNKLYNELDSKTLIIDELEEQLGCPLEVIFRAIYSGVAYETKDGLMESEPYVKLYYDGKWFGLDIGDKTWTKIDKDHFKLSDYKKTWWLKEDRSE